MGSMDPINFYCTYQSLVNSVEVRYFGTRIEMISSQRILEAIVFSKSKDLIIDFN